MTRTVAPAVSVAMLACAGLLWLGDSDNKSRPAARAAVAGDWGKLPLAFEPDGRGRFSLRASGHDLSITRGGTVARIRSASGRVTSVRTGFAGGRESALVPERRLPGVVNRYVGSDPAGWRAGIPTYARVRERGVWPGVDVVYHGRGAQLEYDFELAPGADAGAIGLRFDADVRIGRDGALVVGNGAAAVRHLAPRAFQVHGDRRVPVAARFRLHRGHARFALGRYDRSRPLVIDPVVSYATFAPGSEAQAIGVDSSGNAYLAGSDGGDAVVTKLSASGTQVVYSTVFGGSNSETPYGLAVDGSGQVYAAGQTGSSNFPTPSGSDTAISGSFDGFVVKLSATGSLTWGRYLGGTGTDLIHAIAIEGTNVHVTGETNSASGIATALAYQSSFAGNQDAFYARLSQSTNAVSYASYLGHSGFDYGFGIVASAGKATIAGETGSASFPVKNAGQSTPGGSTDGFIAQFNPGAATADASLDYSTFWGGTGGETIYAIAGSTGNIHATGMTSTTVGNVAGGLKGFQTTPDPPYGGGSSDAFAVQVLSGTTFQNGHFIGGTGRDRGRAIAIDSSGADYVTGDTASGDFPRANWPFANGASGDENIFFAKHGPGGAGAPVLQVAGQIGGALAGGDRGYGIAVDAARSAYVAGYGQADFPTTEGAPDRDASGKTGIAFKVVAVPPAITEAPSGAISATSATFRFTIPETNVALECSLDNSVTYGPCVSPKTYNPVGQGAHTFRVRTSDSYGAKSEPATAAFTVDTVAPSAPEPIAPGQDSETGTQPDFSWKPATDATTAVRYALIVDDVSEDVSADCGADSCTAKSAKKLVTGRHMWAVKAIDEAGNSTTSASLAFKALDPPTARFTIAPNPALVGRNVSFDGSTSADATHQITKYEWDLDGDGSFESNGGTSPLATKAYSKAQTVNVGLRVTDSSGLTGTTTTKLTITSSPGSAAQLGVTINNGAQYTRTPDVVVNAVFPSSTTSMLFSNDGGFLKPEDFKPAAETKWKLDSSGPERLPKIVYVRFLNGPFVSETFTDDIILDETPPKVEQAAVAGAPTATAVTAAAAKRTYTLKIKATDSNSGVKGVYVTANKKKPGKLLKYKRKLKVKAATRKLYVRARDKAGNLSRWRKVR